VNLETVAVLLCCGAALGFIGGLLGVGGGAFAIPLLAVMLGLDQQHAQGTSLVMVVPNVAIGLWRYARKAPLDPKIALSLALSAFPCTFLAAHFATHLPSAPLRLAFVGFVLCIAAYMIYLALHPRRADAPPRPAYPWPFGIAVGAFGGALSGLFGVGGAVFAVPLVSLLFGFSQTVAQSFGLALVAPGTLVGVATYAWEGDVDWGYGIPLALGSVLLVSPGVSLAHRLPESALRLIFASLMVLSAVVLLLRI
jgi:uncharacterized membrane protein YfcA